MVFHFNAHENQVSQLATFDDTGGYIQEAPIGYTGGDTSTQELFVLANELSH